LILKAEANVLIELGEYDRSIKAFKSLKNYVKRWQRRKDIVEQYRYYDDTYVRGTNDFNPLLMSIYHQIGIVYRYCSMNRAAMDYFKK